MKLPYNLQDVYDGEAKSKFTVISTFAGGGGSSTGYRLAGGKIPTRQNNLMDSQSSFGFKILMFPFRLEPLVACCTLILGLGGEFIRKLFCLFKSPRLAVILSAIGAIINGTTNTARIG